MEAGVTADGHRLPRRSQRDVPLLGIGNSSYCRPNSNSILAEVPIENRFAEVFTQLKWLAITGFLDPITLNLTKSEYQK
jgi:hypothetical protein